MDKLNHIKLTVNLKTNKNQLAHFLHIFVDIGQ